MSFTADVYKLCCNDPTITEIYVGSTRSWARRKNQHKSRCNNENSKKYIIYVYQFIRENGGFSNWSMISLYNGQFENKRELERKEREYIEELQSTLNKQIPTRTQKEYNEDNKEHILKKQKQKYERNKKGILEQKKQKYNCECGSTLTIGNKSQHLKTKKHQTYLNSITP
jgi:hypothetical protein